GIHLAAQVIDGFLDRVRAFAFLAEHAGHAANALLDVVADRLRLRAELPELADDGSRLLCVEPRNSLSAVSDDLAEDAERHLRALDAKRYGAICPQAPVCVKARLAHLVVEGVSLSPRRSARENASVVVQCPTCQSKFRIADEKVTDRGVRVRCTSCKNVFQVRKPGGATAEPGPGPGSTVEMAALDASQLARPAPRSATVAPARPTAVQ